MKNFTNPIKAAVAALLLFITGSALAAPVTIDPGDFTGEWDMDLNGVFYTGVQTLDLDEGSHRIRPGGAAQIIFNVDAAGNVTMAAEYDGISANGGAGTLDLLTISVDFDPGDYAGNWGVTRVRDAGPASATLQLVPTEQTNQDGSVGGSYRLYIGPASSAFFVNVRGDGSLTFADGNFALGSAVFDAAGAVRFRNVDIAISDRDSIGNEWIVNEVTPGFGEPGTPTGDQTLTLVPDIQYTLRTNVAADFFTPASDCEATPDEFDLGGVFFDLSCGSATDFFVEGNLFVANSNVVVYSASGTLIGAIDDPLVTQSGDIEFNYVRDLLYVADRQGGEVFVFDRYGNLHDMIGPAPGETVAWGTAIDAAGTAYVVGNGGRINVFDNNGDYVRTISGAFSCCGIQAALSPDGTTLYATETSGFNKGIHAWDVSNNDNYLGFIGDTGSSFTLTNGVATGADGYIYVGDGGNPPGTGTLVRVSPQGIVESTIATGLNAPFGIAEDANGNIWVAEANRFVTGQDKILGFDTSGNPIGSMAPYPEVGQPVGLEFYFSPVPPNEPPTADAGEDQSIRAGDNVVLDGTASFDDNTATANLEFAWSFTSLPIGSNAQLIDANTAAPSFVADVADIYVVGLTVTDEEGLMSPSDDVVIGAGNLAPTASAGDDQLIIVGGLVTLDGSASSDPEMDPLSYSWSIASAPLGSTASLADPSAEQTSFVADVAGEFIVSLDVSDELGPGAPDSATLTVTTAEDFSEAKILEAHLIVTNLDPSQVTRRGNKRRLGNLLERAVSALQKGKTNKAINRLTRALNRTDGCVLRGSPDGSGKGRDWIIDCAVQTDVFNLLTTAKNALEN